MKTQYKVSYLSDGTKVHITPRLFDQLMKWEMEGISIPDKFSDMLKQQDYEWLCRTRSYYNHNQSLDETYLYQAIHQDKPSAVEKTILSREQITAISKALSLCTPTQRRRFAFYFCFGMSYEAIALLDGVDKKAVRNAIGRALNIIRNNVF